LGEWELKAVQQPVTAEMQADRKHVGGRLSLLVIDKNRVALENTRRMPTGKPQPL